MDLKRHWVLKGVKRFVYIDHYYFYFYSNYSFHFISFYSFLFPCFSYCDFGQKLMIFAEKKMRIKFFLQLLLVFGPQLGLAIVLAKPHLAEFQRDIEVQRATCANTSLGDTLDAVFDDRYEF